MGHRFGLMPYFYGVRSFCQLAILSTCHFVNMSFHQIAISSTCHSIKLSFRQLAVSSTIKTGMNCLEVAAISRNGSDVKKHLKDHLN